MDEPFIIGTAGHVDHGKTTLIKALTGIDTDRLKEEQERGMTIDLGFAWLDLPNGKRVGIVDVPGHERFLKNMLAGAGGVDLVLLVIAADEGVMPQTREHFNILKLLDVKAGLIALTKIDAVDEEMLALAQDDARDFVKGSLFENATLVPVSAQTGEGIERLKEEIQRASEQVSVRDRSAPFRLPIDRVFTVSGFGTVVTGTLVAGTVRVGDSVEISPSQLQAKIRNLQIHGESVQVAYAGQRVALNLAGIPQEKIERGQVCHAPGQYSTTRLFDAEIEVLKDAPAPVRHQQRVRLHIGTQETFARILVLNQDAIEQGQRGFVQVKLEKEVLCARGDRFVFRRYSPPVTIGGGTVLIPEASFRKRSDTQSVETLKKSAKNTPESTLVSLLQKANSGETPGSLAKKSGLQETLVTELLREMQQKGEVLFKSGRRFLPPVWRSSLDHLTDALQEFHTKNPTKAGMPKDRLRAASFFKDDPKLFEAALTELSGQVTAQGAQVRLTTFQMQLTPKQEELLRSLERELLEAGAQVPGEEQLTITLRLPPNALRELLNLGVESGRLIRISDELVYPVQTIEELKAKIREHIQAHQSINLAQFRDLTDSSRKYALPLIEYFDSIRFTRRVGDNRILA